MEKKLIRDVRKKNCEICHATPRFFVVQVDSEYFVYQWSNLALIEKLTYDRYVSIFKDKYNTSINFEKTFYKTTGKIRERHCEGTVCIKNKTDITYSTELVPEASEYSLEQYSEKTVENRFDYLLIEFNQN